MRRRAGEFLDYLPKIALIDVIDRWLLQIALLVVGIVKATRVRVPRRRVGVKSSPGSDDSSGGGWLGDLVGKLVEVLEVMVSGVACSAARGSGGGAGDRISS